MNYKWNNDTHQQVTTIWGVFADSELLLKLLIQKHFYCYLQGVFVSSLGRKEEKWKLWPWNKAKLPSLLREGSGSQHLPCIRITERFASTQVAERHSWSLLSGCHWLSLFILYIMWTFVPAYEISTLMIQVSRNVFL